MSTNISSIKAAIHLSKEDLKEQFNRVGLRFTPQREAVWRLFENNPAGFTITRVSAILSQHGIGQATVYRTIRALQDLGYLKWVHEDGGEHRFVASSPGHSHMLVCRLCKKVVACSDCDLSILEKLISRDTGFTVEGHFLEFYGLCPECA